MNITKAEQQEILGSAIPDKWVCQKCGAILGRVYREPGAHYSRLMLLRVAVAPDEYVPTNLFFAKVDDGEVCCGKCGERREWHLGEDFIRRPGRNR